MKKFVGTGVALVTPFKSDFSIDTEALERIVNFCVEGGVDYLVVLGTTGESVTLNKAEKQLVMRTVVSANAGRLPLVLGIGGNSTHRVVHEVQAFQSDDFDAILSVSPYYNKPTQEGIYQHFKAISEVATKPIILYNVPSRTGSNMLPQTTKRLANDFDNIVGLKEAVGTMAQVKELIAICPDDFHIIYGDNRRRRFRCYFCYGTGTSRGILKNDNRGLEQRFGNRPKPPQKDGSGYGLDF
jgi:4-hydroxy-tetrahydrodipicolinate synthase